MTSILSIITTALTAYKFGTTATANILEILPRSKSLYLAILLVTLQLCLSSAVGHSALFQHVEDWLKISKGEIIIPAIFSESFVTIFGFSQSLIGSDASYARQSSDSVLWLQRFYRNSIWWWELLAERWPVLWYSFCRHFCTDESAKWKCVFLSENDIMTRTI